MTSYCGGSLGGEDPGPAQDLDSLLEQPVAPFQRLRLLYVGRARAGVDTVVDVSPAEPLVERGFCRSPRRDSFGTTGPHVCGPPPPRLGGIARGRAGRSFILPVRNDPYTVVR